MKNPTPDLIDRLADKIDFGPECWLWTGAMSGNGYGAAIDDQLRTRTAHRVVYEAVVEPVSGVLEIDHLCRVRRCVNPDHLEPVTHRENCYRSPLHLRRKTHCPHGHPYDEENTIIVRQTERGCRACRKAATDKWKAKAIVDEDVDE